MSEMPTLKLQEVHRSWLPPSTIMLCHPESPLHLRRNLSSCILAAPAQEGLAFWPLGSSRSNATVLTIEGRPSWRQFSAAAVRCSAVERLLPPVGDPTTWCLMLAGWDGEMLPVAVIPLPFEGSLLPSSATIVRPGFDAPLRFSDVTETGKKDGEPFALHLEGNHGRLWAVKANGRVVDFACLKYSSNMVCMPSSSI